MFFRRIGDGHGDANIRVVAVGGERLRAVDHPAAVGFRGVGARAARVGARFGLGERPAAELFALRQRDDIFLSLLFGAKLENVIRAQRIVRGNDDADRAIDAGKLLDDDGVFEIAHARAAIFLGENNAEKPSSASLGMISEGKVEASSHSITCGAISPSANSRTVRRSCCCSLVRENSTKPHRKKRFRAALHLYHSDSSGGRRSPGAALVR